MAMKVTFIGGGSYRVLPIVRAVLARDGMLDGGEIHLYDLRVDRAEAMGRMIRCAPEFEDSGCSVSWGDRVEPALEGADAVQIGFAVGSPEAYALSHKACMRHGFLSSDNVSPTGAFLALKAGPAILDYARRMEASATTCGTCRG